RLPISLFLPSSRSAVPVIYTLSLHDALPILVVVAAVKVAEQAGPDTLVVVLLPDGGRGYLSKVFNDSCMSSYGFLRTRLDGSVEDRKSTRLNSSHVSISYAVFCLKKKKINTL